MTLLPQITLLRALLVASVVSVIISGVIEFYVHRTWSDAASRFGLSAGISEFSYLILFGMFRLFDWFHSRDLLKSRKDTLTWLLLSTSIIVLVAWDVDMLLTMVWR